MCASLTPFRPDLTQTMNYEICSQVLMLRKNIETIEVFFLVGTVVHYAVQS